MVGGGVVIIGGLVFYVASLHRSIAVNKLEAEKLIIEAEKQIDVNKMEAEKKIAEAERKVAERFLLYGYAEEFRRYQAEAGISKGKEEE